MFGRLKAAIAADPWRSASIVLGVALVAVLAWAVAVSARSTDESGTDEAASTTTTEQVAGSTTSSTAPVTGGDQSAVTGTSGGGLFAVKIDNAPGARPQAGLGAASLLIEHLVEGGITRFTAVFEDPAAGVVGPVRSLRPVDADLLPLFAPVVVATGGRPFVLQDVQAGGVETVGPEFPSLFVSVGRSDPYDSYVDLTELGFLLAESFEPAVGLPAGQMPEGSDEASQVILPFGPIQLRYENGAFARYEDGEPFLVEEVPGGATTVLSHDTVVVLFAAERPAGYTDVNDVPVSIFDVIGSGRLLVFHQGRVVEGTWERSAQADGFVFADGSGIPFGLPEGSTHLVVVPRELEVGF